MPAMTSSRATPRLGHATSTSCSPIRVDVVQLLRGGYGASQVVPHLDYDTIAENPKPLVGYSDVTALHVAIRQRTGLVTFYGPGFTGMGSPKRGDWSRKEACSATTDPEPPRREYRPRSDDP